MADDERSGMTVKSDQLRDEMVPEGAMGDARQGLQGKPDSAGEHGELAVESAEGLERATEAADEDAPS